MMVGKHLANFSAKIPQFLPISETFVYPGKSFEPPLNTRKPSVYRPFATSPKVIRLGHTLKLWGHYVNNSSFALFVFLIGETFGENNPVSIISFVL